MGKATRNRFAREPLAVTTNVTGTRDVKGKAKMSSPLSPLGPRVQTPSTASSGVTTRSAPAPASASAKRGWLSRFASMVNLRRRRSMDVSPTASTVSDSSGKERTRSKTLPAESTLVAPPRPTGQSNGWRSDSSLATATGTLQAAPPSARYQPVVAHVVAIPTMHALPAGPTALSPSPYMLGRNPAANPNAVGVVGVAQVQQAQRRRGQSTGAIAIPANPVSQAQQFQQAQWGHAAALSHGGVGMGVYPGGAVVFPVSSAGYPVASASALPPVQGHALPQQQPPALHRSQSHAIHLSTGAPQYLLPDRPPLPDPSHFAPYQAYTSIRPRRVTATSTSSFATAPSRAMSQSSLATGSLAVPVTVARGRQLSLSSQAVAALSSPATTVSEAPSAWATPESHASRRLSGATTASGGTFGPI